MTIYGYLSAYSSGNAVEFYQHYHGEFGESAIYILIIPETGACAARLLRGLLTGLFTLFLVTYKLFAYM